MAKNFEIEAKYLINKNDFEILSNYFDIKNFFTQTNYYFDTKDYKLISNHCAMRIRHTASDEYEATTKVPYKDGLMETNIIVPFSTFNKLINNEIVYIDEIEKTLNKINLSQKDLTYFAKLETTRATCKYLDGELFFDKSTYFDNSDFEIEYEVNTSLEDAYQKLDELFNKLGIHSQHKGYSKIKRCIDYKNKNNL